MAVPYTFGSATTSIPLSQLDSNFATTITLGNTAIQLGNTVTTLNNMTLPNATIASGNISASILTSGTVPSARQPAGSVLQVVSSYTTTTTTTTSATPVDSALSATITPTSSSSKILVLMSSNAYCAKSGVNIFGDAYLYIVRGSTQLTSGRTGVNFGVTTWNDMFPAQNCYPYLDSPATTSATTYKMQISVSNSQSLTVPFASFATMTLMEIAE